MKAIVRDTYGSPDVLELRDIDIPEFADDEVLVRVHAAGVGRDVWHVMAGLPYPIRLAGYGLRAPKNPVIGSDVAGVVVAVGKDVSRFQSGDEVFGIGKGSYAEYVCAREDKLAPRPENLTFEQAAVVAIMGSTALQALRDHGKVRPGQEVLIIGASGGVGTYAVQIAKAFGAHVTGVCSTQKVEMVRSIGSTIIMGGVFSLLTVVSLRSGFDPALPLEDFAGTAGADAALHVTAGKTLVALHDWTFLFGPGILAGVGNGMLLGYLMYRSALVPRGMAVLGLIGGPVLVAAAVAILFGVIEAGSVWQIIATLPEFVWELSLGIWLIVKGFNPSALASLAAYPDDGVLTGVR